MFEEHQKHTTPHRPNGGSRLSSTATPIDDNRSGLVAQRQLLKVTSPSTVVQRVVNGTYSSNRNIVKVTIKNDVITNITTKRITGGGKEGDHTTAYVTFQHMIESLRGNTVQNIGDGIEIVMREMMQLPGFDTAPVKIKNFMADIYADNSTKDYATNPDEIPVMLHNLLDARNGFGYTKRGKASGGKAEAGLAGGLQKMDRDLEGGKPVGTGDPKVNALGLFDLHVFPKTKTETIQMELEQHQMQLESSYPNVFGEGGEVPRKENVEYMLKEKKKDLKGHDLDYSKMF